MDKLYLHKEDATLKTLLARIQGKAIRQREDLEPMYRQPVPEPNCSDLLAFYRSMLAEELSVGRTAVVLGNMYRVSIWLKHRPFRELTREDVIDLVQQIKSIKVKRLARATVRQGYAEQTVESYKIAIKKFWRWLKPQEGPDQYPPEVSWIRRKKGKNGLLPKDIWTPQEVNRVAGLASNMRDRAFVLGLFGSGCRIGEFLPLRRKDVAFDAYSCQIIVEGKTGSRRVRLTPAATVAISGWLEVHPNKDPDAPIWINIQTRGAVPDRHLSYDWAHAMLKDLAARAGISKPIRPHLLRHSLATYYASRLTEAVMNEHFGWEQGGRTAAVYTHLSGRQVDDQILAVFGKKKVDPVHNSAVDVVYCPRCRLENAPSSRQCGKCGFPLTEDSARELCDRRERADVLMDIVTGHPRVLEVMREVIAEEAARRPELLHQIQKRQA